jgi:L-fuconolactonase
MRVDAHHHLWDLAVRDQPWTAGLPALRRSFDLDDLRPSLRRHGVDGTVLVQTITVPEETPEFLEIARTAPEVLGVVGWVDLTGPDALGDLRRLRGLPGGDRLVGVRHQVQEEPDPRWLVRPDVVAGLRAVGRAGLVYDLLVKPHQLEAAVEVTGLLPEVRFVLDHAGKPAIATGGLDPWRDAIRRLAERPNVACKLSGLVTEASPDWTVDDLRPFADHVLACFGPDRVMAGSDWPVCLLAGSYDDVVAATGELLAGLDDAGRAAVLGGTAVRWYGLGPQVPS